MRLLWGFQIVGKTKLYGNNDFRCGKIKYALLFLKFQIVDRQAL